jgi:hypothetical protein
MIQAAPCRRAIKFAEIVHWNSMAPANEGSVVLAGKNASYSKNAKSAFMHRRWQVEKSGVFPC